MKLPIGILLLVIGSTTCAKDTDSLPLHDLLWYHPSLASLEQALKNGANPNEPHGDGSLSIATPLLSCLQMARYKPGNVYAHDALAMLLRYGATVTAEELFVAQATSSNIPCEYLRKMCELLQAHASNATKQQAKLKHAIFGKSIVDMEQALQAGANPNKSWGNWKNTAQPWGNGKNRPITECLQFVSYENDAAFYYDAIVLLLNYGAHVTVHELEYTERSIKFRSHMKKFYTLLHDHADLSVKVHAKTKRICTNVVEKVSEKAAIAFYFPFMLYAKLIGGFPSPEPSAHRPR